MVPFWTRIMSGRDDGLRAGTEVWDDGNSRNGDGCKTPGQIDKTSNNIGLFWLQ